MQALEPSKSLVQQTYESLLDAICAGTLRPGERLSQDDLAERLNVSRQPVNSAIAMLKAQRFVRDTGRRGVVVAPVDRDLFEAIYQFRAAVEPLAVELATPRMTPEAIGLGREINARGRAMIQADSAQGVLQADMDFHSLVYRLSGNPIIVDTMRLNWRHLQRSMGEVLRYPGMSIHVWMEHDRILEAMIRGEAEEASSQMRAHMIEAPKRVASSGR